MFSNLRAELARKGLTTTDIADILGISKKSARNKLYGRSSFSIEEAFKLRDEVAPGMALDELFKKEPISA
jgi:transcriptional regulator with XRE-family HTH domain